MIAPDASPGNANEQVRTVSTDLSRLLTDASSTCSVEW